MKDFLRQYDPADIDYARLDALESKILAVALQTPQVSGMDGSVYLSRTDLARWALMSVLMLFLGMFAGQSLDKQSSSTGTASSETTSYILASSSAWAE